MKTYRYEFKITIDYYTFDETNEVLTKESANALAIFNPGTYTYHAETRIVASVEGKRDKETWDRACKIDVGSLPEVQKLKAFYQNTHYTVSGYWEKVS